MPNHFRGPAAPHAPDERNAAFELHLRYESESASSEATAKHFNSVCNLGIGADSPYRHAYTRWKSLWDDNCRRELAFDPRLLIGLSTPSLWETGITLNPTYGTPVIPGSACKGLARHFLADQLSSSNAGPLLTDEQINALFESTDRGLKVHFYDAWWIPDSASGTGRADRPLVPEVTTPHHPVSPATPFDSPRPIPQIAAHGKFLFVAEGSSAVWVRFALDLLQVALEREGIGARTPEYGRVAETNPTQRNEHEATPDHH